MNTLLLRVFLAAGLCLLASGVRAADIASVQSVQFKDAKVLVLRAGAKGETATNDVLLPGAVKVMTNGTFTVEGGKARKFREGQSLGADGNLTSPDGTVETVFNHVVMKKGVLLLVKDGEAAKATAEVRFPDGTRVKPDGTIAGNDGRLRRMLDGQIMKFNGESLETTDTVTVKAGKAVLQKDGGRVTLKPGQAMMMSDGSKVYSDGTVLRPDGTKKRVAEGEIFKLPGVLPPK